MPIAASPCQVGAGIAVGQPVNWAHPLNVGRLAWFLALPGRMSGPTWYDLAGHANGTLTNMASGATSGFRGTSRPGGWGGLLFDGSDDYVRVLDAPALRRVGVGDFYISFWLNVVTTPDQYDTVLSSYVGSTNYILVSFRNLATTLNILPGGAGNFDAPTAVTLGIWEWWLFGRDGSNVVISRNGAAPTVTACNTSDWSSDFGWTIGDDSGGGSGRRPNMLFDDLSMGVTKPTAAFIAAMYDSSRRGYPGVLNRSGAPAWAGAPAAGGPAFLAPRPLVVGQAVKRAAYY